MAHPQVTDAGTASNTEGSCSLGEPTRVGPPGWELGEVLTTLQRKKSPCFVTFTIVSGLDWLFDKWDGGMDWINLAQN